jgi:hypothetical protein
MVVGVIIYLRVFDLFHFHGLPVEIQASKQFGYGNVFLTLTEAFPCFFLSCKANARVKLAKTGHGPHSSALVVICVVLCIVCV